MQLTLPRQLDTLRQSAKSSGEKGTSLRGARGEQPIEPYYTPLDVAEAVLEASGIRSPARIADFAAGCGHLLVAAEARWPRAELVATDISRSAVVALQRNHLNWRVGRCDFLSGRSRAASSILRSCHAGLDLVVLNPPFSSRGGTRHTARFEGIDVRCSRPMAFVLVASQYLHRSGSLVIFMPGGSRPSERDRSAWALLEKWFCVEVILTLGRGAFKSANHSTAVYKLTSRPAKIPLSPSAGAPPARSVPPGARPAGGQLPRVLLVRGVYPLHKLHASENGNARLLHTTGLRGGVAHPMERRAWHPTRHIRGPAVLVPRVGTPVPEKVCLYLETETVVLSDCVIGLVVQSTSDARAIQSFLRSRFDTVASLYAGTGARFVTLARLRDFLLRHGAEVDVHER